MKLEKVKMGSNVIKAVPPNGPDRQALAIHPRTDGWQRHGRDAAHSAHRVAFCSRWREDYGRMAKVVKASGAKVD